MVANGHGFSFTLQLCQTNKDLPSPLSTPRSGNSYKSPSSRSRDQKRYMQYQQHRDISPQHETDHFGTNNMKDNANAREQVDVDGTNKFESGEQMNKDKHDNQRDDPIKIITFKSCDETSGASTADEDTDRENRQDNEEPPENTGPPKNKVYPGILTARTVLGDDGHSQEFRKRIMDDSRNKSFSKIVKDKSHCDDVLLGISDDLIVESHAEKTFDHFIILDSHCEDKLKSKKYTNIVEAIHKEPPVDEECCTESMNWLQFLLPNLIKQHQKCIRLMDLGTLET